VTTTGPHHRTTPPEKQAAVLADLKSGRFYVFEICRRHRVSSKTVARVKRSMTQP